MAAPDKKKFERDLSEISAKIKELEAQRVSTNTRCIYMYTCLVTLVRVYYPLQIHVDTCTGSSTCTMHPNSTLHSPPFAYSVHVHVYTLYNMYTIYMYKGHVHG